MDEKLFELKKGDLLPDCDRVLRIVGNTQRDKKNKNIPSVRCFSLSPNDEGSLSVDWERKTTPEEAIARFGASFKLCKEEYKSYDNREVYAMKISFLNALEPVESVVYDPIYYEKPEKGRVNNPAHSLIKFTEAFANDNQNDPEIILKMRNHAVENKVQINLDTVHELVKEYRDLQRGS
ncbi:MAG: hypothetical protein PWQ17_2480 [Anaerophaga sp.]|jgi:hypothetical protein|nr:hypothetical protein [Anaerophaga sp.]